VSIVNPLRGRLLTFPFTLGDKREVFERIVEWTSPNFQSGSARVALVFLVLALLLLIRARLPWRDVVPVVAFMAAGLLATRNLPVTAIVIAPVLGRTLRRPESAPARRAELGNEQRINRVLAATLAAAFVLFGVSVFRNPGLRLNGYPVAATTYLEGQGLLNGDERVAHRDFVGNYLELRYGRRLPVFIDDRFDMYPVSVSEDYIELLEAGSRSLQILDDRRVDVVLWDNTQPLPNLMRVSGRWEQIHASGDWVVLRRIG
jgi:hypothetical protein